MRKILLAWSAAICCTVALDTSPCAAEPAATVAGRTKSLIEDTLAPDLARRENAFYALLQETNRAPFDSAYPSMKNHVIRAVLLHLLDRETNYLSTLPSLGTSEAQYWWQLIATVGAWHDPATINVLLRPEVVGNGSNPVREIVALGAPALKRMLEIYSTSTNPDYRSTSIFIFVSFLNSQVPVTQEQVKQINAIFMQASINASFKERFMSAEGLALCHSDACLKRLADMARNDPLHLDIDGKTIYPVRTRAAQMLQKAE